MTTSKIHSEVCRKPKLALWEEVFPVDESTYDGLLILMHNIFNRFDHDAIRSAMEDGGCLAMFVGDGLTLKMLRGLCEKLMDQSGSGNTGVREAAHTLYSHLRLLGLSLGDLHFRFELAVILFKAHPEFLHAIAELLGRKVVTEEKVTKHFREIEIFLTNLLRQVVMVLIIEMVETGQGCLLFYVDVFEEGCLNVATFMSCVDEYCAGAHPTMR